jgi:hypothetical protein
MDYVTAFSTGFMLAGGLLVFSVAIAVLLGRWVTGDEGAPGVAVRGSLLLGLAAFAISRFGTIWYWLALPLALLPLVEVACGAGLAAPWINANRQRRLGEATAVAADDPQNAINQLNLARALLGARQIEMGVKALEEARALADAESRSLIEELASEVREELVAECRSCRAPNAAGAKVCRRCLRCLSESPALRALTWLLQPVLRLLVRRR